MVTVVNDQKLSRVLSEFARTLITDFPVQGILDHLVERIVEVMPVTSAGVTLISAGMAPLHVAASDDSALRFERLQTEIGEGPCISAYESGIAVSVADLSSDHRYPRFAPAAVSAGLAAVFTFRGAITPQVIVALAERSELIDELGAWVLERSCRDHGMWMRQHPGTSRTLLVLGDLRQLGVRLALDDVGSGYSSLSYLARLSLDIVKIDRGFVANIGHDPTNRAIVVAIMNLAHILGLAVVAEGVETQRQCDEVTATGCECAQGFFYATPLPASEIGALIGARLGLPSAHSPASLSVVPTAC